MKFFGLIKNYLFECWFEGFRLCLFLEVVWIERVERVGFTFLVCILFEVFVVVNS